MQKAPIETRVATFEQVRLLLLWAEQEGWNPGLHDAEMFYNADTTGFFITLLNDVPIAGISVVKLNAEHAFLGLYICKPEFRGKNFGIQTWRTAIDSIGTRSIGLDGVVEQQSNYAQEQFEYSHRNVRFAGTLSNGNPDKFGNTPTITVAHSEKIEALALYDSSVGGIARESLYKSLLNPCASRHTYIATMGERVIGVVSVRQCIEGFKIGPWLANDQSIAQALLNKVGAHVNDESLVIDVPEPNQAAINMMKQLNFKPTFETARMYRGQMPKIDIDKLFGVATLELG